MVKVKTGREKRLSVMWKHRDRHTIGIGTISFAIFLAQILVRAARE